MRDERIVNEAIEVLSRDCACEPLWQIGIEIAPEFQGRGIGRVLVSRLAKAVFQAGRILYYSTDVSNVRSQALAIRVGFWPAWTELYAHDFE